MSSLNVFFSRNSAFAERTRPFLEAGLLGLGELHTVDRLGSLAGERDVNVLLGLAFVVRAPRAGHTGVDLHDLSRTFGEEHAGLPWPIDAAAWAATTAASALVGDTTDADRPFVRHGNLLQTARFASYEERLTARLLARAGVHPGAVADAGRLAADLHVLFPKAPPDDPQRLAGLLAVLNRTTVISGGPGTGKTFTIRKVLLLLYGQAEAAGRRPPRVALAAPTGKAAARMREALVDERPAGVSDAAWAWLCGLEAVTLHRLLGWQPQTPSRFRHGVDEPLPVDAVVVDESSMVPLALMCKLVEAIPEHGRLILLGDRNQLASVEAGSVLADLTSVSGRGGIRLPPAIAAAVEPFLGPAATAGRVDPNAPALAGGMIHFTRAFRFRVEALRKPIYALADASTTTDADEERERVAFATDALLASGDPAVQHCVHGGRTLPEDLLGTVIDTYDRSLSALVKSPSDRSAWADALKSVDRLRVLAAHRDGTLGVAGLNRAISVALRERWGTREGPDTPFPGRMILVTENDYENHLWNGDVGIYARDAEGPVAIFPGADGVRAIPAVAMPAHETAFAMTIHKSQGSQFDHAVVVLPDVVTRVLTRELVYTGISRARDQLTVCGSAEVLRTALDRRVQRASGLAERLVGAITPRPSSR